MRVQLLAAVLGLTLLAGLASQVLAQQTVPSSEGASIECPSEAEMMDEMGMEEAMMEDDMMEEAMMEDDMMEEGMAQCPKAKPVT